MAHTDRYWKDVLLDICENSHSKIYVVIAEKALFVLNKDLDGIYQVPSTILTTWQVLIITHLHNNSVK